MDYDTFTKFVNNPTDIELLEVTLACSLTWDRIQDGRLSEVARSQCFLVFKTNTSHCCVFICARNNELSVSGKYELGRIMRYVEQQRANLNGDGNAFAHDLNQINVNQFCTVVTLLTCN